MKQLTLSLATFVLTTLSSNFLLAQFNMEVKTSSTKTVNGRVVSSESSHSTISSENGLQMKESTSSYKDGKFKSETNEFGLGGNNNNNVNTTFSNDFRESNNKVNTSGFDSNQKTNNAAMNRRSELDEFMKPRTAEEIALINKSRADLKRANAEAKKAKAEAKLIKAQTKQLKEANKIAEKNKKAADKAEAERKRKEEGVWITQKIKSADSFLKDKKSKKQAAKDAENAVNTPQIINTQNTSEISE